MLVNSDNVFILNARNPSSVINIQYLTFTLLYVTSRYVTFMYPTYVYCKIQIVWEFLSLTAIL